MKMRIQVFCFGEFTVEGTEEECLKEAARQFRGMEVRAEEFSRDVLPGDQCIVVDDWDWEEITDA